MRNDNCNYPRLPLMVLWLVLEASQEMSFYPNCLQYITFKDYVTVFSVKTIHTYYSEKWFALFCREGGNR